MLAAASHCFIRLLAAGLLAVSLGGCDAPLPTPPSIVLSPQSFESDSGDAVDGSIGTLAVPERHSAPSGPQLRLTVARFESLANGPAAPIIYLEGGPGGAGIHPERMPLIERLREVADVITFDQRGSGASTGDLDCPEPVELPAGEAVTFDNLLEAHRKFARRCAASLEERGIDLSAYNALESAADVRAIAEAFGLPKIQLVGISFGSHVALTVLRNDPGIVERAVLAAVEGVDATVKMPGALDAHLAMVSELMAADPVAGRVLPDFESLVRQAAERLDRNSYRARREDGALVVFTGFDFRRMVTGSIVRRQFLRLAPQEYGTVPDGDFSALAAFLQSPVRISMSPMRAAMDCASGVSADRWQQVKRERSETLLRGVVDFPFPDVCEAWGVEPLPDSFRTPFTSDTPLQMLTGSLDGLTPAANAIALQAYFPESGHLLVTNVGHEAPAIWFEADRILEVVLSFLKGSPPVSETIEGSPIDWELAKP